MTSHNTTPRVQTSTSYPSSSSSSSSFMRFITCASGICFSYWFYGFLQEKIITKSRLGATFMLVVQTVANILVALLWQHIEGRRSSSSARKKVYSSSSSSSSLSSSSSSLLSLNHPLLFLTSSCYVLAMAASNESLRFVSYPVAVLGKSCKMIPTMIMGLLIERRQYKLQQWLAALSISCGIALFHVSRIQEDNNNQSHFTTSPSHNKDDYWKGMVLLFLSLCMDGLLGACQGMMKRSDPQNQQRPPTAVETMLFVNLYALVLLIPMAMTSGQWDDGLVLLMKNGPLRWNVIILNAVVAVGQIFIFLTITWYSSLITTTITTTRKFFTILFSVFHFGHAFSMGQWTSVILVFTGLFLSIATEGKKQQQQQNNIHSNNNNSVKMEKKDN
jgi:solute carrier family 35 (UDP-galactose transporter), member B1